MPTYEYECGGCGHRFEVFIPKITDPPAKKCPKCARRARARISGGAGVIFKGSGFYSTEYRKTGTDGSKKTSRKTRRAEKKESSSEGPASSKKEGS